MKSLIALFLVLVSLAVATQGFTQQAPATSDATTPQLNQVNTPPGGDSGENPFDFKRILTRFEFWLSLLILLFGAIVVVVQFSLLRRQSFDGNDLLKVFGVTLIIVGTLFLIAAGFGDKQIAPAMGLFGTLAGYLLGRASAGTTDSSKAERRGE